MLLTEYNEQKTMAAFRDEGFEDGFGQGVEKGKAEGTLETLAGLVKKGRLTIAEAAEEDHMTEEEFTAKIANI